MSNKLGRTATKCNIDQTIAIPNFVTGDSEELDEKVKSMMEKSQNVLPNGGKICGKEIWRESHCSNLIFQDQIHFNRSQIFEAQTFCVITIEFMSCQTKNFFSAGPVIL